MSMTAAYLLAKCKPVPFEDVKFGQTYRVVGWSNSGGIFIPERIEGGMIYFRGYVAPAELKKVK